MEIAISSHGSASPLVEQLHGSVIATTVVVTTTALETKVKAGAHQHVHGRTRAEKLTATLATVEHPAGVALLHGSNSSSSLRPLLQEDNQDTAMELTPDPAMIKAMAYHLHPRHRRDSAPLCISMLVPHLHRQAMRHLLRLWAMLHHRRHRNTLHRHHRHEWWAHMRESDSAGQLVLIADADGTAKGLRYASAKLMVLALFLVAGR